LETYRQGGFHVLLRFASADSPLSLAIACDDFEVGGTFRSVRKQPPAVSGIIPIEEPTVERTRPEQNGDTEKRSEADKQVG